MRFPYRLLSLIALISLIAVSCEPKPEVEHVPIIFEVPLTVSPLRDTIAVGDTLWLTASFSDSIQERTTKKRYRVTPQNFNFRSSIGLYNLVDSTKTAVRQPGFASNFSFINKLGSVSRVGNTFGDITYHYDRNQYQIRIGITPLQKGIVCLSLLDIADSKSTDTSEPDLSFLNLPPTVDGRPRRPTYATTYYVINEGHTNFRLFQQHCKPVSLNVPSEDNIYTEQKGTYTFVVK